MPDSCLLKSRNKELKPHEIRELMQAPEIMRSLKMPVAVESTLGRPLLVYLQGSRLGFGSLIYLARVTKESSVRLGNRNMSVRLSS